MQLTEVFMVLGFALAAYSVVSNDSIQTLGTFLAANARRPWWHLWMFSSSILVAVLWYSWLVNNGDPSYGRLTKFPEPAGGVSWLHMMAPLVLLILTRFGIPVSTTFLVLSVFAPGNIESMLLKSVSGYLVAFVAAFIVYILIRKTVRYLMDTSDEEAPGYWYAIQWASTAFLWSQWLIQDLANIFVFLPRELSIGWITFGTLLLVLMQGVIFYQAGGRIQQIVTSKSNVSDVRSASIINFIYGLILLVFKEWSNMPMSTTWVFLGLLAGREIAIALQIEGRTVRQAARLVGLDAAKAGMGLLVSVLLAFLGIWIGI